MDICARTANSDKPFEQLALFKIAASRASNFIQHRYWDHPASTIEECISATSGFLRATHTNNIVLADKFLCIYSKLKSLLGSAGGASQPIYSQSNLARIQDHLIELCHTSIQQRVDDLKHAKQVLPEHIYKQRKNHILTRLKRLLPGHATEIQAIKHPSTGHISTQPSEVAACLTNHWQQTFLRKDTNAELRKVWFSRLEGRRHVPMQKLLPTKTDVEQVLDNLPSSAAGPDGVPFAVYKALKGIVAPIFFDISRALVNGTGRPPEDFNWAFLVCIPKSEGEVNGEGLCFHEASNTRPLSIVDASNRILASMLLLPLERHYADWISPHQRGFIKGRQMLRNVLDVDYAAHKISLKTKFGAILLFDFRAAFPSLSHDYLFEALAEIGLPLEYVNVLKLFYSNNQHRIRIQGQAFDSVKVHSGVRQGCPLSPFLFALSVDILLREIARTLSEDEALKAFADDTAAVVSDFRTSLPKLHELFRDFHIISCLALNVSKTVFVPLWCAKNLDNVRTMVSDACPPWANMVVQSWGKYLGFYVGPGAIGMSWRNPLATYVDRARTWSKLPLGTFYGLLVYKVFIVSVLSYVMQLESEPLDLMDMYDQALRKLLPGPGNWLSRADAQHLKACYCFPLSLPDPRWLAFACKLRVVKEIAPDCVAKHAELENLRLSVLRPSFSSWHDSCYMSVLAKCYSKLVQTGLSMDAISAIAADRSISFQSAAEEMISGTLSEPYFPLSRLRVKLVRWRLPEVGGVVETRLMRTFALLSEWCHPRVLFAFFKTLWNGWSTDRRMSSILQGPARRCILGCQAEDSIEHYSCCPVFWKFASTRRPVGLGIRTDLKGKSVFFLVREGLRKNNCIRIALAIHALYRISCLQRVEKRTGHPQQVNFCKLLSLWVRRAADGSKARSLLLHQDVAVH